MPEHDPTRTDRLALYMRARAAEKAGRDEAVAVVERWNAALTSGRGALWSPTIRCALLAGMPWLDVHCPGCGTSRAIDVRSIDRHPLASVGGLVLGLRCSMCLARAPMPLIKGLHAWPPAVRYTSTLAAKAKWIGTVEAVDEEEAIERGAPKSSGS
jgi:hypothetical protein